MYNYMKGRWKDGQRFTLGGNGLGFSNIPTSFMFPGNPPEFWSEFDSDGQGSAIAPADRRFVMATGPFTINPDDEQTLVFGIVTSFGDDNLDSVQQMKSDDALAQAVFDIDFELPSPPAGPRVSTTVDDGSVLIEWGYNPTDNNYLNSYNVIDPLLSSDVTDNDYVFEGYNVYQYANSSDQEGKLLAVYDVPNGITRVIEGTDLTFITADGTDRGVQTFHKVPGLTNYQDYEFGVQAYAYNATSGQKVYAGPITRFSVVPQISETIVSEDAVAAALSADVDIQAEGAGSNIGNGSVSASIVNPHKVTGDSYSVEFYSIEVEDDGHKRGELDAHEAAKPAPLAKSAGAMVTVYDVKNGSGTKVFDGTAAYGSTHSVPIGENVLTVDGVSLNVLGPEPGFVDFKVTANASGPLATPVGAAADWYGFPGLGRPSADQQVGGGAWMIQAGGGTGPYAQFLSRWARNGLDRVGAYDYEIRFTGLGTGNTGLMYWGSGEVIDVPFQIWNTGIGTPDDPSDDYRYCPLLLDENGDGIWNMHATDHPVSGASNDPYTDWIYWYECDYAAEVASGYDFATLGNEIFGRTVFVNWNGGDVSDGTLDAVDCAAGECMPEDGTVFRVETTKPNQPGDMFSMSTDGLGARARTEAENRAAIDEIGITPNPYKGVSSYEVSQLVDQVRFTNMPNQATIRIFTVAGTLVRTLEKNSASASFPWDLTTEEGLPIASGMYIIHVDTEWGEKVLKFGVVKKRIQLNTW
jgi:hypothetical protein